MIIVTSNTGKFQEMAAVLREFSISPQHRTFEFDEVGTDLAVVAQSKAQQAWDAFHEPVIVEDMGVYFTALDDFPGAFAKRRFQELGYDGLLQRLDRKPRDALFKAVLVYKSQTMVQQFEGILRGRIAHEVSPTNKRPSLPYDRIFIPEGQNQVMGELPDDWVLANSHRAQATRQLGAFLQKQ